MGSRKHFRYVDARGREITDEEKLERIRKLVIPPAWREVWISPSSRAKLQATGVDAAGRRQYLYHADFRAQQEQATLAGALVIFVLFPDRDREASLLASYREEDVPPAPAEGPVTPGPVRDG